jgi:hypothetical protein
VLRDAESVQVIVREGVVVIDRKGDRARLRLAAPGSAQFALDGSERAVVAGHAGGSERPSAALPRTLGGAVAGHEAGRDTPAPAVPLEPSIADVEDGVSHVLEATQDCFTSNTGTPAGGEVTARTTLHFQVLPDGGIREVSFEPPLAPSVETCARDALDVLHFAGSQRGITLTRVLELRR